MNTDYTERVRGFAKGTVDDHITRLANGDTPQTEDFRTREQAAIAAEAHRRLEPTHEVSDPYPVTMSYTTPKKGIEKTKTVWRVDAQGTRQIDPFAIGVRNGKEGEPNLYAMSYNYNSAKAGNIRSYRIDRFNDTVAGFDASKIDENSPFQNQIKTIQDVANVAKQQILDNLPNRGKGVQILDHFDNGRTAEATKLMRSELKKIKDPATLEKIEAAFKVWCQR